VLLDGAIHFVCGDSAAGTLRAAGLDVRVDPDVLAVGPAHRDPAVHTALRRGFWRSEYGLLTKWRLPRWREVRWPRRGGVALWTSTWLVDRLFFWRAVDRAAAAELWRVDAASRGVGSMPTAGVPRNLSRAQRMTRAEIASARRYWAAWTSGDLPRVAAALERPLRKTLLDCLPRTAGTKLRLSRRDEMLLRGFSTWRTPLDVLRPHLPELLVFGDFVAIARLRRWERSGALVSRAGAGKELFTEIEFVLTPLGTSLLRELRSPSQAPAMFMGGHEIYGPRTWAVTARGEVVRARLA
jgi:hypothetical protein